MGIVRTCSLILLVAQLCAARVQPKPFWMEEDTGAIVLLSGGARTFLCVFDSMIEHVARPLEADLFAYMKVHTQDPTVLRKTLESYERFQGAKLVPSLDCEAECLLPLVGCRKRFTGYLSRDQHLGHALAQHKLLELLGHELRKLETERGKRYAWVAWVRPDVAIRASYPRLSEVENSTQFLQPCGGDVDMGRVLPRDEAERLLFSNWAEVRRECEEDDRPFAREAEDFVRHAIPHNHGCLRARPLRHGQGGCQAGAPPSSTGTER